MTTPAKPMPAVSTARVVTYRPDYRSAFERLNTAWLEELFAVEAYDLKYLRDPGGLIIEPGGEVFFLVDEGEVLGTCALIKRSEDTYELGKMAVDARARGRGYGHLLMKAALAWARRREAARIILFSNTTLTPALKLYEKHGFVVTRYGPHPDYARADIEMQLDFGAPSSSAPGRVTAAEALARLPGPGGERFAPVLEHGTLLIEVYAPRGHDPQTPHTRDEVYVVVEGRGMFVNGDARTPFGPGDVLFVPAGVVHRFEDFTDDLAVWVIFYGPEGGEARDAATR